MVTPPAWYFMIMPTYEFTCDECGHDFEITSSIAQRDEKAVCPKCGSRSVKTVFGSFAVGGAAKSSGTASILQRGFGNAALSAPKP